MLFNMVSQAPSFYESVSTHLIGVNSEAVCTHRSPHASIDLYDRDRADYILDGSSVILRECCSLPPAVIDYAVMLVVSNIPWRDLDE